MTINISAYDTTACASFAMSKVVEELKRAGIAGSTTPAKVTTGKHSEPFDLYLVQGGNSFADAVPYFKHPVLIDNQAVLSTRTPEEREHDGQAKAFVVDVRDFGKWSTPHHSFLVRNGLDYTWSLRRAILNQIWMDGRPETLRDLSNLPAAAYAALVSECVSRRFALDPAEQMTVAVFAAYFYYGLYTDEQDFSLTEKQLLSGKIAQITHVPAERVLSLLENTPLPSTLVALCDVIKDKINNVALENFNVGTLLAVVCSTWIGYNAREVVAVGLEHIPTWLTIVSSSLEMAMYKRSTLAKIVQRFDKGSTGVNFLRSLELLLGGPGAVMFDGTTEDEIYRSNFAG